MRYLPVHRRRLRFAPRREHEGERPVIANFLDDLQRLLEILLGLTREADDDVGGDRAVGNVLADQRHAVHVAPAVVGASHPFEHRARARLQRQVDLLAEGGKVGVSADHVLLHVLRVRARVADAVDALDRVDPCQQHGEGDSPLLGQVPPVAVDVLPQQRHLAHPVGGEGLGLGDQLGRVAADLAPPGRGDDAVGADAVAALGDLQPALELALAPGRQVAGEVLELEVALGTERFGVEELGQLVDLAGTEGDVDEREALENLVLDRLRPAAADADDTRRVFGLEPLRLAQVGDEATVGGLADRTGVEEDHVGGVAALGLLVAERCEHAPHPLGVVHVHLAPEGGDVKGLHDLSVLTVWKPSRSVDAGSVACFARERPRTPRCAGYRTVSVPSMPASRWPGTVQ